MATDIVGMRDMLTRYTSCLPQSRPDTAPSCNGKTIALLGSTGFLGPYIVASLLEVYRESKIFCLNRSTDGDQRTTAAVMGILGDANSTALQRLHYMVADITQPNFGLDAVQATVLASEVNEFIFNAWDPNWSRPLAYFDPFLKAVRNAIDFCSSTPGHPGITFVSSICSVGNWPLVHPAQPIVPEEVLWDCRSAMPHGYGESKCVAEQLLAKAHEASGLRVNVVRAGQIGGPSRSRVKAWPRPGWIHAILQTSLKLGYFPMHVQPLDWIPVDAFAAGIVNSTKSSPGTGTLQVYNMVHPEPSPWKMLYDTLASTFGITMETTSLSDWLDKLDRREFKLHGFLRATGNGREHNMSLRNENALQTLPEVVPLSEELLADWLRGWKFGARELKAKM